MRSANHRLRKFLKIESSVTPCVWKDQSIRTCVEKTQFPHFSGVGYILTNGAELGKIPIRPQPHETTVAASGCNQVVLKGLWLSRKALRSNQKVYFWYSCNAGDNEQ